MGACVITFAGHNITQFMAQRQRRQTEARMRLSVEQQKNSGTYLGYTFVGDVLN